MTSGGGIAHSEETPSKNSGFLNGVQLWVALPDSDRHGPALWNFVARTPEEIANARSDWQSHQRFGDVTAYQGPRLTAPPLQRFASPNPVS
jgi:redox-sensitive bicupin YhaK (pirin superfamily)